MSKKRKADKAGQTFSIACKEARETLYWLKLLEAAEVIPDDRLKEIRTEANELVGILTAIIKSTKEKAQ